MPLDNDIMHLVQGVMLGDLAAPKVPRGRLPKLRRTWKCEHPHDFLYGHRVGYYKGLVEGMMIARYGRKLLPDEDDQIFKLTDRHAKLLREYFRYYRSSRIKMKKSKG